MGFRIFIGGSEVAGEPPRLAGSLWGLQGGCVALKKYRHRKTLPSRCTYRIRVCTAYQLVVGKQARRVGSEGDYSSSRMGTPPPLLVCFPLTLLHLPSSPAPAPAPALFHKQVDYQCFVALESWQKRKQNQTNFFAKSCLERLKDAGN